MLASSLRWRRAALALATLVLSGCGGSDPQPPSGPGWSRRPAGGWEIALEKGRSWSARLDAKGERLEVDAGRGRTLALVAGSPGLRASRAAERGRALRFSGGDVDRWLTPREDGVKEDLVVTSAQEVDLSWTLEVPAGAAPRLDADGSVRIDAPSPGLGRRVEWFRLPAPAVEDAHGPVEGAARYLLDGRRLRLVAKLRGLAFPVTIDPTVVVTLTADFVLGGNEEGGAGVGTDEVRRDSSLFVPTGFGSTTPLPDVRTNAASVEYGGRIYVLGGRSASGVTSTVYVASVSGTTVGPWATTTALPIQVELAAATVYDGFVFVLGGKSAAGAATSSTWSAPINSDGTLGSWVPLPALTSARSRLGAAAIRGRLFVAGGEDSTGAALATVEWADLHGDGLLGSWTAATGLPAARRGLRALAYRDFLYAVGGAGSTATPLTTMELAKVDAAGGIARWWSAPGPVTPVVDPAVVAAGGRLYTFGGCTDASMPCATARNGNESAPMLPDGSAGAWIDGGNLCCNLSAATAVRTQATAFIIGGLYAGSPDYRVTVASLTGPGAVRSWTGAPALSPAREMHASAQYGPYLYVFGGCDNNSNCRSQDTLASIAYARVNADGTAGAWMSGGSFTNARWGLTAVPYNGYMYLIGGKGASIYGDVQRAPINSDGSLGAFTQVATVTPVYRHGSFAYHGYLYVVGGGDSSNVEQSWVMRAPIDSAGGVGAFTTVSNFPNARRSHATSFYNGTIYVSGGTTTAGDLADVEYASISSTNAIGPWTAGPPLPVAMRSHASAAYDGFLYIAGGYSAAAPGTYYAQIYAARIGATGALGAWTQVGALTSARAGHTLEAFDGKLITSGGDTGAVAAATNTEAAPLNDNGLVEPWATGTALPQTLREHQLAAAGSWIYALGGIGPTSTPRSGVYRSDVLLDGTNSTWTTDTLLPRAVYGHRAITINGRIYVVGGYDGTNNRGEVYFTSPSATGALNAWTATTSLPLNQERMEHALAYARGHLFVLGGDATTCTATVYHAPVAADGTVGAWVATTSLPAVRTGLQAVAYGGYVYVLGGEDCAAVHDPTVYSAVVNADGSLGAWTPTTTLPLGESYAAAAASDGFVYLWGGDSVVGASQEIMVAPVHENGKLGAWTFAQQIPAIWSATALGLTATAGALVDGRLFIAGGTDDLGVDHAEVYATKASTPAASGAYSRRYDLGSAATLNSVTVNGAGSGPVRLEYRVAPGTGGFGAANNKDAIPLGSAVALGDTSVRYAWLRFVLDDRNTELVTPGNTAQGNLADITLDYTSGADSTPPIAGAVNDGSGADITYQQSTASISANWSGFSDPESGITGYEWAIGTAPGGIQVQNFTSAGASTAATATGLSLTTGTKYYVTVRATNGSGLTVTASSDGVTVDATAPLAGTVNDGLGADDAYQPSTNSMSANWSGFADDESGIAQYEWAIGTTPGGTEVRGFTSAGPFNFNTATGLSLTNGARYYVTVRATNGSGLTTTASSDGVTVDSTGPLAGTVNDGTGADIDVQASTTSISANWSGFSDAESGIASYQWSIGTALGANNIRPMTPVGLATSATASGLSLVTGKKYYVTVLALDGSSFAVTAFSNGVIVDGTAPVAGTVNDGTGADIDLQTSTSRLDANWGAFSDPESGIAQYDWAIGTSAGAQDVQPFTPVGLATAASASGLSLTTGTRYFVTVRATDGVGRTAAAGSNGVVADNRLSLAFASASQSLAAGQCSGAATVEIRDALGAQAPLVAPAALSLTSDSGSMRFYAAADSSCSGVAISSVALAAGDQAATFRLWDSATGTPAAHAAADLGAGTVTASQQESISAGAATSLQVSGFPSPVVAGTEGTFTVSALDGYGNLDRAYAGTVTFSSSDSRATFPSPAHSFAAGDAGRATFRATLVTAGPQWIRAGDGTLQGEQSSIDVRHAPASRLAVGGIPSPINVGAVADLSVRAEDPYGNTAADIAGALTITSSDLGAQLPQSAALLSSDNGAATFASSIRFATPGLQRIDVALAANPAIAGAEADITVADQGPPWIVQEANLLAALGAPYRYSPAGAVRALGTEPITFTLCGTPAAGLTLDPASGQLDWIPQAAGPTAVCIDATNAFGSDRYPFTVGVQSRAPTPVTAAFTALPASGAAPLDVELDGSGSTADPTALPLSFEWFPGDGSPVESGSPRPHRYLLPGGYLPRLVTYDAYGDSASAGGSVAVLDGSGNRPPSARIAASPATAGRDQLAASFSCDCREGSAAISGYAWAFGGGNTSSAPAPSFTFGPGAYQVTLLVIDANGLTATDSVQISVSRGDQQPPDCLATASPTAGPSPLVVRWDGTFGSASSHVTQHSWALPDGTSSSSAIVRTTETPEGVRAATLTVQDEQGLGCESRAQATVLPASGYRPTRILSAASDTAECAQPYHYSETGRAAAQGEAPLTWSLAGPQGATIDASTGALTWTPSSHQTGTQHLTLTASAKGGQAVQDFDVQVSCPAEGSYGVGCGCSTGAAPATILLAALALWMLRAGARRRSRR